MVKYYFFVFLFLFGLPISCPYKTLAKPVVEMSTDDRITQSYAHVRVEFSDGNVLMMLYLVTIYKSPDKLIYELLSPDSDLFSKNFRRGEVQGNPGHSASDLFIRMFYELKNVDRVDCEFHPVR